MTGAFDDITVVIPTFNEAANIGALIRELAGAYQGKSVLVVDDASTDGTPQIVKRLSVKFRKVHLLQRKRQERGLTASIICGLKAAKSKYVIVMDGDFQHPPETVSELVRLLRHGSDLAVACRSDVPGWQTHRKLMSRGAEVLGRLRLHASNSPSCSDILSGFFGVKRQFALAVYEHNKSRFVPEGYKFLFDLLKCAPRGTRVGEVGYIFGARAGGSSKIGARHCNAFVFSLLK